MHILNRFFFDEDTITLSDGLWYYGVTGIVAVVGLITFGLQIKDLLGVL